MNIVIQTGQGANFHIRSAICNGFRLAGYPTYFWNDQGKSAFDLFREIEVNVFIGSTWQLNRSLLKNLMNHKPKVILYSDAWIEKGSIDLQKYPIGVVTDEQISNVADLYKNGVAVELISNHSHEALELTHVGWPAYFGSDCSVHSVLVSADITQYYPRPKDENYHTQLAYVGGYWPYKSINLDKYILPFTFPSTKWHVRLFGNGWNGVNAIGTITNDEAAKHYSNADIIPHVVEPHASDIYGDIPLRYMEVAACGGFAISCPVVGIRDVFTENELVVAENPRDFQEKIVHYLNNPAERESFKFLARKKVCSAHTNLHRCKQLLEIIEEDTVQIDSIIQRYYDDVSLDFVG